MRERRIKGRMSDCELLLEAEGRGAIGQVEKHLSRGVSSDCRDEKGRTPLIRACASGKTAMAAVILRYNPNVNLVDEIGYTALISAAFNGHMEAVKLLMSNGADPTIRNDENLTASEAAAEMGFPEVATYLSAQEAAFSTRIETSENPDDDGPTTDGPAGVSLPAAAAMAASPEPRTIVPELDLDAMPSVAESPYFKALQEPDTTIEGRKQEAEAQPQKGESESAVTDIPVSYDDPGVAPVARPVAETPETASTYTEVDSESSTDKSVNNREDEGKAPVKPSPNSVVEAPKGSGNDQKASAENTRTNPLESILTFVMGMVMPGVANPRLMYDLLCQGTLERFRGRTINEAAQDIQIIVFSAVSNILMFLGYYLLVAFFDKNPAKAFSRNPKKQTSLNELAQQKGMPFTRQRLSECVRCAALDMALRKMGLHLDSLTYYHYAEISKLPKLKDQIALAQLAELQRLTAGEVKERVGKQLGKISSEDKRIAKAVMRNVGDILRLLTDEETQDFLKDKERMKAAFEPTESTALLGNIRKLKKKIPVTEALFTDLEPSLLDLLREYTHQDKVVDVEVEQESE